MVCEIHGEGLYPIRYSGVNPKRGVEMICWGCVWALYSMGEIARGEEFEYINRR